MPEGGEGRFAAVEYRERRRAGQNGLSALSERLENRPKSQGKTGLPARRNSAQRRLDLGDREGERPGDGPARHESRHGGARRNRHRAASTAEPGLHDPVPGDGEGQPQDVAARFVDHLGLTIGIGKLAHVAGIAKVAEKSRGVDLGHRLEDNRSRRREPFLTPGQPLR